MRCFNGSSTECSLYVDAPPWAGVPRMGLASTRSDCSGGDPGSQAEPILLIGNLPAAIHRENPVRWRFCYDEVVWQRVAIRQGRDAVKHGRVFVKHVVPAVIKPARTLWNEVIGFVFGVLAIIFGFRTGRLFLDYTASAPESQGGAMLRFVIATGFT